MRILLLHHYPLSEGPSMRGFADQIATGLRDRGHQVNKLTAPVCLARLGIGHHVLCKWLGYFDQFVLFPPLLWLRVRFLPAGSLCVVSDQALGPWIPWIKARAHLVHAHDLLALEGALGLQPFHAVGSSGRIYQRWIRHGFRQARCFLSVSAATQRALSQQLVSRPLFSEVLYNPLPGGFLPLPDAASELNRNLPALVNRSFLFHIGSNWYKNRQGVLAIWEQLCLLGFACNLVLVGALESSLESWLQQRPYLQNKLHVLVKPSDGLLVALYNQAEALLFPSHAEGFGWPILEAMACGCPVITTDQPPMNEVAGDAATLIPPAPQEPAAQALWARQAALMVQEVLHRPAADRQLARERGIQQARRFHRSHWLDRLESYYQRALDLQERRPCVS